MIRVENATPLRHLVLERMNRHGATCDLIIVKGTFTFEENGAPMQLAPFQSPIRRYDDLKKHSLGHRLGYEVARAHDVATFKPGTDVVVVGEARSPNGEPHTEWPVEVRVGSLHKQIRVTGPRRFVKVHGAWVLTEPTPVSSVPLDYRHAFGGHFLDPTVEPGDAEKARAFVYHRENAAGCGWLPTPDRYARLPREVVARIQGGIDALWEMEAPQIEPIGAPLRSPYDVAATDGIMPTACWWEPRVKLQGTLDDAWRQTRAPCVPIDYDDAYEQAAPAGLVAMPYLQGGEEVELSGVSPQGTWRSWVPRVPIRCVSANEESARSDLSLKLDTVVFDVDTGRCEMAWRVCVPREEGARLVTVVLGGELNEDSKGGKNAVSGA